MSRKLFDDVKQSMRERASTDARARQSTDARHPGKRARADSARESRAVVAASEMRERGKTPPLYIILRGLRFRVTSSPAGPREVPFGGQVRFSVQIPRRFPRCLSCVAARRLAFQPAAGSS